MFISSTAFLTMTSMQVLNTAAEAPRIKTIRSCSWCRSSSMSVESFPSMPWACVCMEGGGGGGGGKDVDNLWSKSNIHSTLQNEYIF